MSVPVTARAGRKGVLFVLVVAAAIASADEVLFPEPLHFVRRVTGIDGGVTTLHEYCSGNQVVTVSDGRVVVADFTRQELLEIDRVSETYSITSFTALAAATPAPKAPQPSSKRSTAAPPSRGGAFVVESDGMTVELRAHESLTVSRRTLDVLLGAAWPHQPPPGHDVLVEGLRATRDAGRLEPVSTAPAEERFRLPAARTVTARVGPDVVKWKSEVVSVDNARVPPDALVIPRGARLVESPAVRGKRELDQLDRLPHDRQ